MGIVYRARQVKAERIVALKMILAGAHASAEELERFRTEAEAAARLQHPNIVQVFEVGEHQGLPYFSLEYCPGGPLAQKLAGTPLPPREAGDLVLVLARAVAHAHKHGVIHRDLKPGNVLLGEGGTPKITDFGLAKKVEEAGQTATGEVMGTPSYMAPEQAEGRKGQIGPACDIYALGAVLYECLTGRPPFKAPTSLDTILQVVSEEPVPPGLLNPGVDPDLQAVCMKCLEKELHNRYPSAEALAEDLNRCQNGEPVEARSYNILLRLSRALEKRSHTHDQFRSWATMLFLFAAIVLVGHLVTFGLIQVHAQLPPGLPLLSRGCELLLVIGVFWYFQGERFFPTSRAEKSLGSIWLGYLAANGFSGLVIRLFLSLGLIAAGPNSPEGWNELIVYPMVAILSGLAFFVMGGFYWGRYYAVGLAFFLLALVMPLNLPWAPLEYALLWTLVLVGIGLHLRNRACEEIGIKG
jgi:serine/threonine-protein kinase